MRLDTPSPIRSACACLQISRRKRSTLAVPDHSRRAAPRSLRLCRNQAQRTFDVADPLPGLLEDLAHVDFMPARIGVGVRLQREGGEDSGTILSIRRVLPWE